MNSLAKRQAPPWLEHSLRQAASLARVPGLPADAVLCIRHLTARLDTHALQHAGSLLGTAGKLSQQLQILAEEARRPACEIVPESTTAILFDDPAQMLACAARDWLDGQFANRWWWRTLLGSGALAQGVIPLWRLHARHVPAALAELNARALDFCRRIAVADAEVLVARLVETYALPTHSATRTDWPPPLPELAPEDPRRQLLAIGLSLTQTIVRAHRAFSASRPTLHGVQTATPDAGGSKARRPTPHGPNEIPDREPALRQETEARAAATGAMVIPEQQAPLRPTAMRSRQQAKNTSQRAELDDNDAPMPNTDDPQYDQSSLDSKTETTSGTLSSHARFLGEASAFTGTAAPIPFPAPPLPSIPDAGQWFETRYGGVLYLLNVAIHLGLYPDFTQPRSPGLALSPWAFLTLSGERLAGRRLRRDALWTLLAALAGTEAEHPLISSQTSPPSSLPETMRPYLGNQKREAPIPADSWPTWLDQLIPPLRRRLAAALGVPPRQAGRLLCCESARIRFSTGRLDAHFNLNEHPIAIRLSGLDHDPGWIPSAGCDIRFFYDGTIVG